ncbi:NUDIX hydrolase [Flammeovirga sp. MY04]|uniref:NUDIX domain-containing protein n=1 Tax=Flammeovirga sp. MY04 TaxID=1191459 RepID=UPI0008063C59|nr:NUDIX domain-containing protein [Flammeovirga sp. MY04]ANQ48173.1 NUDIX hydrolase [Flammeovirga sp. MY04]
MKNDKAVEQTFGHRLRVRVCGVLVEGEKILMAVHRGIGPNGIFWAPPGGGLEYGETVDDALKREFLEETGLEIELKKHLFTHEFHDLPLHGIELFFLVEKTGGSLKIGHDPEMEEQILENMVFIDFKELAQKTKEEKHHLFRHCNSLKELINMQGFYSNLRENL